MKNGNKKTVHFFTITELVVAMGVFAIISILLLQTFSGTQKVFQAAMQKSDVDESARLALDFIENDIRNVIDLSYTGNKESGELNTNLPTFYGIKPASDPKDANNVWMCINDGCSIKKVRYHHIDDTNIKDDEKPYYLKRELSAELSSLPASADSTFTANTSVIAENVVEFSARRFTCASNAITEPDTGTTFPDVVIVTLKLIAPEDAAKYTSAANTDKPKYVRTYVRTMILGKD